MKKRFLAGLLTAVLLVSLLPVSAFASEDEQNSGLTAAEQTETTQAAEIPEAEPDIQNVPAETASSESSSVDVTDFSFYAVRTWQSKGYYDQRSESRIQLTEKDGEYILYVPVNGINDLGRPRKVTPIPSICIILPIVILALKTRGPALKAMLATP